ncbi:transposase family protein [Streptomyces sp. NPDC059874]|uniref:transposase family protein n=1 Tax=Streptomyces sp. NPDC059874 TaxID=3346983 RepID=UPI003648418C
MEEVMLRLQELLFPAIADVAVLSVDVGIETVRVDAQCTTADAACPGCGAWSTRGRSTYLRFLADVPSAGRSVVLRLRVRRFRCGSTKYPRRTFVEQIPGLTRRYGRRTERLRSTLAAVGLALAGRAGAGSAAVLGMSTSDTVIRPASPVCFASAAPSGSRATTLDFQNFVRTEGALYAFTPSIPTLRALAEGSLDNAIEVHPGTVLRPADSLDAGSVRLRFDAAGGLTLQAQDGQTLWGARTAGSGVDALFAANGELSVRDAAGKPLWSSRTGGAPGARLLVRPSGDAVILRNGRPVWRVSGPSS